MRRYVIERMRAWHEGPHGGRCPRVSVGEQECSQYGISAVSRYGALAGVLLAAHYVAVCRVGHQQPQRPGDCLSVASDPSRCWFGKPNHPFRVFLVLAMFARLALLSPSTPEGNRRRDDGCGNRPV